MSDDLAVVLPTPDEQVAALLLPGQVRAIDHLAESERYGTSRLEVLRYLVASSLEAFEVAGLLRDERPTVGRRRATVHRLQPRDTIGRFAPHWDDDQLDIFRDGTPDADPNDRQERP